MSPARPLGGRACPPAPLPAFKAVITAQPSLPPPMPTAEGNGSEQPNKPQKGTKVWRGDSGHHLEPETWLHSSRVPPPLTPCCPGWDRRPCALPASLLHLQAREMLTSCVFPPCHRAGSAAAHFSLRWTPSLPTAGGEGAALAPRHRRAAPGGSRGSLEPSPPAGEQPLPAPAELRVYHHHNSLL